jgi:hypothetical protein
MANRATDFNPVDANPPRCGTPAPPLLTMPWSCSKVSGAPIRRVQGTYGPDVNFPVPFDEQNNPNFVQCVDRNP